MNLVGINRGQTFVHSQADNLRMALNVYTININRHALLQRQFLLQEHLILSTLARKPWWIGMCVTIHQTIAQSVLMGREFDAIG